MIVNYFDLGCNIGSTIEACIKSLSGFELNVYGVEADKDLYLKCVKRLSRYPFVQIYNFAITYQKGSVRLYKSDVGRDCRRLGYSIYRDKRYLTDKFNEVGGVPFSSFLESCDIPYGINILKSNIEGAEYDLVRDMDDNEIFDRFDIFLGSSVSGGWHKDMAKIPSLVDKIDELKEILLRNNVKVKTLLGRKRDMAELRNKVELLTARRDG